MQKISAENLNSRLIPGISNLYRTKQLTIGNVHATQVYIHVNNFQILLVALGEDLFHRFLTRFYTKIHVSSVKYHGYFSIENPNKISIIFGIQKDDLKENRFFPQKSIFFGYELQKQVKAINTFLKETVHTNYNRIRNQYLRLPLNERAKIDIGDLKLDISIGMATSYPSPHRDIFRMQMLQIGSEFSTSYGAYGGVPYLAQKLCDIKQEGQIIVCENTANENERLFCFEEIDNLHLLIHGSTRVFVMKRPKTNKEIFFINRFLHEHLSNQEESTLHDILSGIYAGNTNYSELKSPSSQPMKLTLSEFESFQGSWMSCIVNGILAFILGKMTGFDREKCISLAITAAWHHSLNIEETCLPLDERYKLKDQVPEIYRNFDYDGLLHEIQTKKILSQEAALIKMVYAFDKYFFKHDFDMAGMINPGFEREKQHIERMDGFSEDIYKMLIKVLTD